MGKEPYAKQPRHDVRGGVLAAPFGSASSQALTRPGDVSARSVRRCGTCCTLIAHRMCACRAVPPATQIALGRVVRLQPARPSAAAGLFVPAIIRPYRPGMSDPLPAVASWRDQIERLSEHASPCRKQKRPRGISARGPIGPEPAAEITGSCAGGHRCRGRCRYADRMSGSAGCSS